MKKILLLFTVLLSYTVSAQIFVPNNGTSGQVLQFDDKYNTSWVTPAAGGDNMANADLTLDAARSHDMDGNSLAFTNTGQVAFGSAIHASTKFHVYNTGGYSDIFSTKTSAGVGNFAIRENGAIYISSPSTATQVGLGRTANSSSILNIQGINATNSAYQIYTQNSSFALGLLVRNDGSIGMGTAPSGERLLVKGLGATSATTTALFENSSGTDALEILDNTKLLFGGTNNAGGLLNITGSAVDSYTDIQGYRTNGTTKTWGIEVDAVGYPFFKGYETNLNVGTAAHYIEFKSTHNRFEFWNGGAIPFSFDNNGIYPSYINTELIVNGPSASKEAALKVIGNGATSATTTVLFENSAGDDVLKIQDNGDITFGNNQNIYQNVKVTISSAQILALNTTPIEVVPAPPSGYAIRVISASGKMNFLTAAYATSTTIGLCTATATLCQLTSANLLGSATSIIQRISNEVTGVGTQLVDNQALTVTSLIADPTAGSGTLDLYITYELIKL